MARFCSLFSSSSGNCTYIGTSGANILIDVGVSAKRTDEALRGIGVDPDDIDAIFITHEHSDHINGVRVFASKHNIKVYATPGTLTAMEKAGALSEKNVYEPVNPAGTEVNGFFVKPFATSHDAAESCGYTVLTSDSKRLAVCTDLGVMTDSVMNAVYGSELVLLESNHDVNMLLNGDYPYPLKRRILSEVGHLSNDACAETAVKLIDGGTTRLVLGHLSKENNHPGLAAQTTVCALSTAGMNENSDYLLEVAGGDAPHLIAF